MSNVRLSNSPTLERMDVRLSDQHKSKACKSLFGPVDHGELKKDLKGHLQAMERAASEKWNFDFVNHEPLADGPFEWHALDSRDVPEFYNRGVQRAAGARCVQRSGDRDGQAETSCQESAAKVSEEETGKRDAHTDYRVHGSASSKRPGDHDESASHSKRSRTSSDESSRDSACSAELTPRKSHT